MPDPQKARPCFASSIVVNALGQCSWKGLPNLTTNQGIWSNETLFNTLTGGRQWRFKKKKAIKLKTIAMKRKQQRQKQTWVEDGKQQVKRQSRVLQRRTRLDLCHRGGRWQRYPGWRSWKSVRFWILNKYVFSSYAPDPIEAVISKEANLGTKVFGDTNKLHEASEKDT